MHKVEPSPADIDTAQELEILQATHQGTCMFTDYEKAEAINEVIDVLTEIVEIIDGTVTYASGTVSAMLMEVNKQLRTVYDDELLLENSEFADSERGWETEEVEED